MSKLKIFPYIMKMLAFTEGKKSPKVSKASFLNAILINIFSFPQIFIVLNT